MKRSSILAAALTCPDCIRSAAEARHGFTNGCLGCAARSVARGPNYREAMASGRHTWKYRDELRLVGVTHDQVKAAAAADALGKETA